MVWYPIFWFLMVGLFGCTKEPIPSIQDCRFQDGRPLAQVSLLSCRCIGSVCKFGATSKSFYILQCKGRILGVQSQGALAIIALPKDVVFRSQYLKQAIAFKASVEQGHWDQDMFVFWKKGNGGCAENVICTLNEDDYLKLSARSYAIYMLYQEKNSEVICQSYESVLMDPLQERNDIKGYFNGLENSVQISAPDSFGQQNGNSNNEYSCQDNSFSALSQLENIRVGFTLVKQDTDSVDAFRRIISSVEKCSKATMFKDVIVLPGKLSDKTITASFDPGNLPMPYDKSESCSYSVCCYIEQNNNYVYFIDTQKTISLKSQLKESLDALCNKESNLSCTCMNVLDIPSMQWVEFNKTDFVQVSSKGHIALLLLKKGPHWSVSEIEGLYKEIGNEDCIENSEATLLLLKNNVTCINTSFKKFFKDNIADYKYAFCLFSKNGKLQGSTEPKDIGVNIKTSQAVVDKPSFCFEQGINRSLKITNLNFSTLNIPSNIARNFGFLIGKPTVLNDQGILNCIAQPDLKKNNHVFYLVLTKDKLEQGLLDYLSNFNNIFHRISRRQLDLEVVAWMKDGAKGIIHSDRKKITVNSKSP